MSFSLYNHVAACRHHSDGMVVLDAVVFAHDSLMAVGTEDGHRLVGDLNRLAAERAWHGLEIGLGGLLGHGLDLSA